MRDFLGYAAAFLLLAMGFGLIGLICWAETFTSSYTPPTYEEDMEFLMRQGLSKEEAEEILR